MSGPRPLHWNLNCRLPVLCCLVVATLLSIGSQPVLGGVMLITSEATFDAQGDILQTANYDDFGAGLHVPANPLTRGGVSLAGVYVVGANTVASNGTPPLIWNPIRNVPLFPFAARLSGNIDTTTTTYRMFGFKLGYLNNFVSATHPETTANILISTNSPGGVANYNFTIAMPGSEVSLAFSGFVTDNPGEYFTSFEITGSTGYFPGITDLKLGQPVVSAVPEPQTLTLVTLSVLSGLLWRRGSKAGLRKRGAVGRDGTVGPGVR